ncbi:MAG: hypothetical protein R3C26_22415 [Calditrichia bacterium]
MAGIKAIGKNNIRSNCSIRKKHRSVQECPRDDVRAFLRANVAQPHDAMIWLNNAFVGKSRPDWFGQDTASINNFGNSSAFAHRT